MSKAKDIKRQSRNEVNSSEVPRQIDASSQEREAGTPPLEVSKGAPRRPSSVGRVLRTLLLALLTTGAVVATATEGLEWAGDRLKSNRPLVSKDPVVVPGRLLRRWDPVTVFFPRDTGPSAPGAEDQPERYVVMRPGQPGSWLWLDARTLQFRPAVPWTPLSRVDITVGSRKTTLSTIMEPPLRSEPANNAEGLEPLEAILLTFADPIPTDTLSQMLRVELRPLPGVDASSALWLERDAYTLKPLERPTPNAPASYLLAFRTPIPEATRALLHFTLAAVEGLEAGASTLTFATADIFRAVSVGCGQQRLIFGGEGARFTEAQALRCEPGIQGMDLEFTSPVAPTGLLELRNLLRIDPAVPSLRYEVAERIIRIRGDFQTDTLYHFALGEGGLKDAKGRRLIRQGPLEAWLSFADAPPYVAWDASQGVVERFGPQRVPVKSLGYGVVDLRIHRIPALDRNFSPWPLEAPVKVDETLRPPSPGEEPLSYTDVWNSLDVEHIARHIATLGSPLVSSLVDLTPYRVGEDSAHLDLAPLLEQAVGKGAAGTFLVGMRRLDEPGTRSWMRVQVTDLSLTTLEERNRVVFVVTSLSTGAPVSGATIRLEGRQTTDEDSYEWAVLSEGVTDKDGRLTWNAPGDEGRKSILRLSVQREDDVLVLDPNHAPDVYSDNLWSSSRWDTWLQWAFNNLEWRAPAPAILCHLFPERPVYRPDEPVHLKGYVRQRVAGKLTLVDSLEATLLVRGPGGRENSYPVELTEQGSFYQLFDEKGVPAGEYEAELKYKIDERFSSSCATVYFKKEAYRLPRFEVKVHGPDSVPLDQPFDLSLTSTWYAGGRVAGRPVRWRVTQFPYTLEPPKHEGFLFSSEGRFSRVKRFEATPDVEKNDTTSVEGISELRLDPTLEPGAQPRKYVVEATVTGDDDQTVTDTKAVVALPPFLLGLKVPRYLEKASALTPEVLVVDYQGKPLAGREVTVRLLHRQWHSHLQVGDFSEGVGRYITDVVDEKVMETAVSSAERSVPVSFPVPQAGVYVVELEARDRMGRAQVVAVDLYAGGKEPVAWPKSAAGVFSGTADKASYVPGETGVIVVNSPFQEASALVVIEAPEGNEYRWQKVKGGVTTVKVPIRGTFAPKIPVHVVLMRGRLPGVALEPGMAVDPGKPATVASTTWLSVQPVDNRVDVTLEHPSKAGPGDTIPIVVRLKDPKGKPLAGEVTLWLVDQAVLALGRERPMDPLRDFILERPSELSIRDTRSLAFGLLPQAHQAGGGVGGEALGELLDRATVRRNFKTVPYYNPQLMVGPDGIAKVTVTLPDNLTNFKVRAKASSGAERFGSVTGVIAVRLPFVVQPTLPRFVRPGDQFTAEGLARVVEGASGPGLASLEATGAVISGEGTQEVTLTPGQSTRMGFPVDIPTPAYGPDGKLMQSDVTLTFRVARRADGATDAVQSVLPLLPDRPSEVERQLTTLEPGGKFDLPAIAEDVRQGTLRRTIFASSRPEIVKLAAGLDALQSYPYGCTEQRLSQARGLLAVRKFRSQLALERSVEEEDRVIRETLKFIPLVLDRDGLAAFWPGSEGYVALTAWVLEFMNEAKAAGYSVDEGVYTQVTRALQQSLRSDYGRFIEGAAWAERTMALVALTGAGRFDPGYAAELTRRAEYLDQESAARVARAFAEADRASEPVAKELAERLWGGLAFELRSGKEALVGLQERTLSAVDRILPSETRTMAETARALQVYQPSNPRLGLLEDALIRLGKEDGWGSTQANASALLALSERMAGVSAAPATLTLARGTATETLVLGGKQVSDSRVSVDPGPAELVLAGGGAPVGIRVVSRYVPKALGSEMASRSNGLVVTRTVLRVMAGGAPMVRLPLERPGTVVSVKVGDVLEEHIQLVSPRTHTYLALVVPLAAGVEPLNPGLATSPPEARTAGRVTLEPTYVEYLDDRVAYYYNVLPTGTYDFYFRTRATVPGQYSQPSARAELMYDSAVSGQSNGARVVVER